MKKALTASLLAALFIVAACTKSGGSGDSGGGDSGEPAGSGEVRTDCGVVYDEELHNPATLADGVKATVKSANNGNVLVVATDKGNELIKLHALQPAPGNLVSAADNFIMQAASGSVTLFRASTNCTVNVGGGTAFNGQIITASGKSLSEELLLRGYVTSFETSGACGEGLVGPCYKALKESDADSIAGTVSRFLWKPEAAGEVSSGRLVVLTDACNADIIVNGEHLKYDGENNGYCSIGRAPKTGCAYGGNAKVEIRRLSDGASYLFPDGTRYYTIPNGCSRVEFGN